MWVLVDVDAPEWALDPRPTPRECRHIAPRRTRLEQLNGEFRLGRPSLALQGLRIPDEDGLGRWRALSTRLQPRREFDSSADIVLDRFGFIGEAKTDPRGAICNDGHHGGGGRVSYAR